MSATKLEDWLRRGQHTKGADGVVTLNYEIKDGAPYRFFRATLMRLRTPKSRDAFIISSLSNTNEWATMPGALPGLQKFFANKVKRSDRAFFIKLGRALHGKRKAPFSKHENFLLSRWDRLSANPNEPMGLKHFTDPAALTFTNAVTRSALSLDAYKKMRKRLGLNPEKPVMVRCCKVNGREISLFQKTGQNR